MPEANQPAISVVIPCRNEAENLAFLIGEVDAALAASDYEVLVVDDGSTDGTAEVIAARIAKGDGRVRHIRHDRSAGQSAAVRSGVFAARGKIIATMDGDGQNDPAFLPKLVEALEAAGPKVGIAAGQRLKRTDTQLKRLASRFANGLRESILHDGTRDSGCGLKAIRTDLFRTLPYFDGWHRYLPALVMREGFRRRPYRRGRPLAPPRKIQLRHSRSRPARSARPDRRLVAAPPSQDRARDHRD